MADLAKRRAELVEKLVSTVLNLGFCAGLEGQDAERVEELRARFTTLLASRWQT